MAVAILVTQDLKDKNASFFSNNNVGTIVSKTIPDTFNGVENINGGGYRGRTDLQALDGWKEVVRPSYNTQTQRLGSLIDGGNVYTYEVIDLTAEEIEARLPSQISKLNFKIGLLTNHGITNDQVQAFFNTLEDPMQKEKLELLWFESSFFERNDSNLVNFAPALGLTQEDLKTIFIDFDGY
jgi:hypothetical protein